MTETGSECITVGDHLIIQRQKYTKLQKFSSLDTTVMMGKDKIELRNLAAHPYHTTFKLVIKEDRNKRLYVLEACTDTDIKSLKDSLNITESGVDNRNICDDGLSQGLSSDEILKLRENYSSSNELIGKLVENSKSFANKTEYSQEKYLKKKEKKYFEFIQIKKPTIRLITEIYYRQDPDRVMGVRFDTLSQIISYSGACSEGNFLLYESGTNGVLPAAILNSLGANTSAKLVHMHPGNVAQKHALQALNLSTEHLSRCISVNLYSVLRQYYQNNFKEEEVKLVEKAVVEEKSEVPSEDGKQEDTEATNKRKLSTNGSNETPAKVVRLDKWVLENNEACLLLKEKLDGLIVVAKEHPYSIVKALLPFIKPSRPVVVFNTSKELLMECYIDLKGDAQVTYLKLTSNWTRMYQILPNRTHPDVNMSGNSGYLLTGYTIR